MFFGLHVSVETSDKNLESALIRNIKKHKINCCQIFVANPRSYALTKLNYEAIAEVIKKYDIVVPVHSNYLTIGIWGTDKKDPDFLKKIHNIRAQLEACQKIGAYGFVIHLPRKSASEVVGKLKDNRIIKYMEATKVPILLENMPVKNAESGKSFLTPSQINELITELKKSGYESKKVGICIDTAHLWGGGVDLSTKKNMDKWLSEIKHPEYIRLIHLNGAKKDTFNSGQDKHAAHFSELDEMFGGIEPKKSGVYALIKFAKSNSIPIVCEFKETGSIIEDSLNVINNL